MARTPAKARKPVAPAAAPATTGPRYCSMPESAPVALPPGVSGARARAILKLASKWANGTILHYHFFTNARTDGETVTFSNGRQAFVSWVGAEAQRAVVRKAFAAWKALGIGLEFKEVARREEAEVRIGFMAGDGSWSYIGTENLGFGPNERTMNFGWDLTQGDGYDTALHEIGHTLGLPHEHQNPYAGIVWDEEAVYTSLAQPPNKWSRDKTFHNIIRKIAPDTVQGSNWDPDSVMHYPFEAGMILQPAKYAAGLSPAGGLSPRDVTWIKTFYPEQTKSSLRKLEVAVSQPLGVKDGQQADFLLQPTASRKYKIATFGVCDTQIVLFEEVAGAWRYSTADDDSGEERNALLNVRLLGGKRYAVRVRLKYSGGAASPTVMAW